MDILKELLRNLGSFALAYSGGLDSRYLAHAAQQAGVPVHLYHMQGAHVPQRETQQAKEWAEQAGLPLNIIDMHPLAVGAVTRNGTKRCYHCKQYLFSALLAVIEKQPPFPTRPLAVCDGTNASDSSSYRPGLQALRELGIRSPLAEAGMTKRMIRESGAATGLTHPDQVARPCLLTRFAYGISPTEEALYALDAAEAAITDILRAVREHHVAPKSDIPDFRVRLVESALTDSLPICANALPFMAEFHVSQNLPDSVRLVAERCIVEHGFQFARTVFLPAVSGHYDVVCNASEKNI